MTTSSSTITPRSTKQEPLSNILPPLIFGTATFNGQYNPDPYALDTTGLVHSALELGVRAFDTSPYYGPSEILLGAALNTDHVRNNFPREEYFILTKCGRISANEFDYSPGWVRKSVARSCERLHTNYLDVVYLHDIEFVSAEETIGAVRELRRLRDEEGAVRYIGICGYPIDILGSRAELIRDATGEPIDIVQSYAHFSVQNQLLAGPRGIERLRNAGVDVIPNASILGMGLLRHEGLPVGSMGDWHPSPQGLREAAVRARDFCDYHGERLEVIAIRYALEHWLTLGASVGSRGDPASGVPWKRESNSEVGGNKLGVSVMGVSKLSELQKTMQVWRSILDGLEGGQETAQKAGRWKRDHEWSLNRKRAVEILAEGVQECFAEWMDFAWESPDAGWTNKLKVRGHDAEGGLQVEGKDAESDKRAPWPTPDASPEPENTRQLSNALPLR